MASATEQPKEVRVFTTEDAPDAVLVSARVMLDEAFEGEFAEEDWEHCLGGRHFVMIEDDGSVVAHAAVVPRVIEVGGTPFRTGYVEGVGTSPRLQGRRLGSAVMSEATAWIRSRFELGALGTGRHSFYERRGWERWRGPSFVRTPAGLVRSPEDDGGIMVLRFGPSRGIDLEAPISCDERPGDDW